MIWIDTDMGFDDMLAVMMVEQSPVDIAGVSLVYGNTRLEQVVRNAFDASSFLGWTMPLFAGASRSILGSVETAERILGTTGMPTLGKRLPESATTDIPSALAGLTEWLEGLDDPNPVLALGPLTNIAILLLARPDLAQKISHVLWMGGGSGPGNHTASAEFNAFSDPEAVAIVLASGVELRMVDLECCRQVLVGPDFTQSLNAAGDEKASVLTDLMGGYIDIAVQRGRPAMALYDPVAAAIAIGDNVATLEAVRIDMELAGGLTRGRTVVDRRPSAGANARIAVRPDAERIRSMALDALEKATRQ
ncbi:MAG: nucleoside hydrolase [Rhizobiaceae bacterium MnEN-MB40S]|nr:MAG: nucleoside hydrolase [Rhizobiaceae bacterium MnEN-MB40S]